MIYKRGRVYWYKFMWQGKLVRESTKQGNDKVARQIESAHRTSLAKGEVGIREKKTVPTLFEFCSFRVEPWAKARFEKVCHKNWTWYRTGIRALTGYKPLATARLDHISGELASEFAAHRLRVGMQVSTANNSLRVLRRILNLAVEWSMLGAAPKVRVLPGERRRERVITPAEEARYLAAAPEPLASVASVLSDSGMRPEECFRLCWENVTWLSGRNGTLMVTHGKTAAARRVIPMTPAFEASLRRDGKRRPNQRRAGCGPPPLVAVTLSRPAFVSSTQRHSRPWPTRPQNEMRNRCAHLCFILCDTLS